MKNDIVKKEKCDDKNRDLSFFLNGVSNLGLGKKGECSLRMEVYVLK